MTTIHDLAYYILLYYNFHYLLYYNTHVRYIRFSTSKICQFERLTWKRIYDLNKLLKNANSWHDYEFTWLVAVRQLFSLSPHLDRNRVSVHAMPVQCMPVVSVSPMFSMKFADIFAVLNVIRFPKSYDFCASPFTSDFVFIHTLPAFLAAVRFVVIDCFSAATVCFDSWSSLGRAITMAAPTDNAHNNAPQLGVDEFILMRFRCWSSVNVFGRLIFKRFRYDIKSLSSDVLSSSTETCLCRSPMRSGHLYRHTYLSLTSHTTARPCVYVFFSMPVLFSFFVDRH